MPGLTSEQLRRQEIKYVRICLIAAVFFSLIPALYAWLSPLPGSRYLGMQYNTDDHMVYAAWMRQSMDGRFFFDNRFTDAPQPGLTVNLLFLPLGWVAKLLGIPLTMTLARAAFTGLFVWLLYLFLRRLRLDVYTLKLALSLTVVGGGLGFLVWHHFGVDLVRPGSRWMAPLTGGKLPIDVWQPEAFVFPSMLTSALFMVSLCFILTAFLAFLSARESAARVPLGWIAMFLLMNMHSYDVLLIALVMLGFLAASWRQGQVTPAWLGRAGIIASGAILPALWFLYVVRHDPVFAQRAADETLATNFRTVLFGFFPMILLAFAGAWPRFRSERPDEEKRRSRVHYGGMMLGGGLLIALAIGSGLHRGDQAFLQAPSWGIAFVAACAAAALLGTSNPTRNLLWCWALVGIVAPYFPAAFQRKLAMGLSIPWAILAALGLAALMRERDRSTRNLVTVLALVLLSATSIRWLFREIQGVQQNVSNTTRHPVFLGPETQELLAILDRDSNSRRLVVAIPGMPSQYIDSRSQEPVPDAFGPPLLPDLSPILSGLTGVYTYAGHWSETPDYNRKVGALLNQVFFATADPQERVRFLTEIQADYLVAPNLAAYPDAGFADLRDLGEVIFEGPRFLLIRL